MKVLLICVIFTWIYAVSSYKLLISDSNSTMAFVELNLDEEQIHELENDSVGMEILRSILAKHDYETYETTPLTTTESSTLDTESSYMDSWSAVWYIASFSGLITFFLVVSCSEWCCRKGSGSTAYPSPTIPPSPTPSSMTPPPDYELFAPPSYDLVQADIEKKEFKEVYVVPVHTQRQTQP